MTARSICTRSSQLKVLGGYLSKETLEQLRSRDGQNFNVPGVKTGWDEFLPEG